MMVDQFTKWVKNIPVASQTAELTAQTLVSEFISRFVYPFQIFSDQGGNFASEMFAASLMDAVRYYIGTRQHQWDMYEPQVAIA